MRSLLAALVLLVALLAVAVVGQNTPGAPVPSSGPVVADEVPSLTAIAAGSAAAKEARRLAKIKAELNAPRKEEYTPAKMGPAPAGLKKPRIYTPKKAPGAAPTKDADEPVYGSAPENLKKPAITNNIFGGAVEFAKGTTPGGCPCQVQVAKQYRYDAEFKPDAPAAAAAVPCPCAAGATGAAAPAKKENSLPVLASLYPDPAKAAPAPAAPCPTPAAAAKPPAVKVSPEYYPAPAKNALQPTPAPCPTPAAAAAPKPATVAPEFYPPTQKSRASDEKKKA